MSFDELSPQEQEAARNESINRWRERSRLEQEEFKVKVAALSDEELLEKATRQYQVLEMEGWSRTAIYSGELTKRGMEHPPRPVITQDMLDNW